MAGSISKAQADALADNFNFGGDDRADFQPEASLSALYQLAGGLVGKAQENLIAADNVSSGRGAESITVLNPERVGKTVRIDISMLYYLQFIDAGVKGVKSGSGKYSFKTKFPGKKMMEAIRKWIIKEGLKSRTKGQGRAITRREVRRRSITDTSQSVAYAIASSVKQKGIKASRFMEKAIRDTRKDVKNEMGSALKIDVIAAIPKKLEDA